MNRKIKTKKVWPIRDDTGKLLVDENEINEELESYFKVLLNHKAPNDFDHAWIESEIQNNVTQNLTKCNAYNKGVHCR